MFFEQKYFSNKNYSDNVSALASAGARPRGLNLVVYMYIRKRIYSKHFRAPIYTFLPETFCGQGKF